MDTDTQDLTIDDAGMADDWANLQAADESPPTTNRDATGKFTSAVADALATDALADATEADATADAASTEDNPAPTKTMPASWRREMAEHWDTLPEPVKDEIAKREEDVRKGFTNYKAHAELGQRFQEAAKPYEQYFQQFNVTAEESAQRLFNAEAQLRFGTPAQKQAMFRQIAQDYGIDINGQSLDTSAPDSHVAALEQRLAQIERERAQQVQQTARSEQQKTYDAIAEFAYERDASTGQPKTRGTDEYGNPVLIPKAGREHFEAVRNLMSGLISADNSLSLADAYDRAVHANPTTRQALHTQEQAQQRAEATRKAQLAKEANVVNIRQRGTVDPKAPLGSLDDTIRDEAKALGFFN